MHTLYMMFDLLSMNNSMINPFPTDLLVSLDSCTAQLALLIPDSLSQGFSSSLIDRLAFCSSVFLISFLSLTYTHVKGLKWSSFSRESKKENHHNPIVYQ